MNAASEDTVSPLNKVKKKKKKRLGNGRSRRCTNTWQSLCTKDCMGERKGSEARREGLCMGRIVGPLQQFSGIFLFDGCLRHVKQSVHSQCSKTQYYGVPTPVCLKAFALSIIL